MSRALTSWRVGLVLLLTKGVLPAVASAHLLAGCDDKVGVTCSESTGWRVRSVKQIKGSVTGQPVHSNEGPPDTDGAFWSPKCRAVAAIW